MDQILFVALDRRPLVCNVDAVVGDQFTVEITFYDVDGADAVSDLTGDTASMEILCLDTVVATITGTVGAGVVTFDFVSTDLSDFVGRHKLRVKLVRDTRSSTVIDGFITVRE